MRSPVLNIRYVMATILAMAFMQRLLSVMNLGLSCLPKPFKLAHLIIKMSSLLLKITQVRASIPAIAINT